MAFSRVLRRGQVADGPVSSCFTELIERRKRECEGY